MVAAKFQQPNTLHYYCYYSNHLRFVCRLQFLSFVVYRLSSALSSLLLLVCVSRLSCLAPYFARLWMLITSTGNLQHLEIL